MNRTLAPIFGAAILGATIAAVPPAMPQPGGPQPQPAAPAEPMTAATAVPTADPAMLARAKNWFAQLQAGKIDRSQIAPTTNAALTDAKVASASQAIAGLGPPTTFELTRAGQQGGVSYALYALTFK